MKYPKDFMCMKDTDSAALMSVGKLKRETIYPSIGTYMGVLKDLTPRTCTRRHGNTLFPRIRNHATIVWLSEFNLS